MKELEKREDTEDGGVKCSKKKRRGEVEHVEGRKGLKTVRKGRATTFSENVGLKMLKRRESVEDVG